MPSYYEADSPLWDQLVLRLDEHQLSYERTLLLQTQKHQQHKQKRSASQPPPAPPAPKSSSPRESSPGFKTDVPWTRKAFARLLFMDNADFRKFASAFVMTDPFTLNALRFHAAYSDLCTDMSDALGDAYQLALPRHTAPSFGIARFLSPILCPRPTAPPLSVPTHLVPRFRTLWNTYLNDSNANSQTYLATSLRSDERAALRLAITAGAGGAGGDRVWCGVLDESVAKILEDVYRGAFAAFVERYGYSPLQRVADAQDGYDEQDSVLSSSPPASRRSSSGLRTSTQQQPPPAVYHHNAAHHHYPSPATTPSSVVSSPPQLRYSSSRRDSIYSDTMMTSPSRASTMAMPAVPPRASSLRPPPVWAVSSTNGTTTSTARHSSARSSSAGARKPVYAATTAAQDVVQRDSGVSVGSSRTGK
ncbi:hypothetical protein HDU88_008449 [Geranomyces variabilis]|nr:hypothetical protein HDU88_008449 [Geranomyces variabilis]